MPPKVGVRGASRPTGPPTAHTGRALERLELRACAQNRDRGGPWLLGWLLACHFGAYARKPNGPRSTAIPNETHVRKTGLAGFGHGGVVCWMCAIYGAHPAHNLRLFTQRETGHSM